MLMAEVEVFVFGFMRMRTEVTLSMTLPW